MYENKEEELWPSEDKKVIVVIMKLLWKEATLSTSFSAPFYLCFHVALLLSCVQFYSDFPVEVYELFCKSHRYSLFFVKSYLM